MPYPIALIAVPAATQTASGVGTAFDLAPTPVAPAVVPPGPPRTTVALTLAVTALSAGATLDVRLQTSRDGVAWRLAAPWTDEPLTEPGDTDLRVPGLDRWVRVVWTLAGPSPSATFGVGGEAILVMATPVDFRRFGVSADALAPVPLVDQDLALEAATDDALAILGRRYALPLRRWSLNIRKYICQMAAPEVLIPRGLGPEAAAVLQKQATLARERLDAVGSETTDPQDSLADATPGLYDAGAFVSSAPRRGWL